MNPLLSVLIRLVLAPAGLLVTLLPRGLEVALGRGFGRFLLAVDFKRRRIAEENLRLCFPELPAARRARILVENYEHYGCLALELMHMFSPVPGHFARYAKRNSVLDDFEVFERLTARGKGTIAVTGHFANWEMMAAGGQAGINTMVTGKKVKPEWLNDIVVNTRAESNVRTASGKRILPELLRWIKAGNTSAFIMDQYAAPPSGVPIKFFGALVDTQGVVGLVAQRTGAPIFIVFTRRDERGVIHLEFQEAALDEETLADPLKVTQALASMIEAWLRKNPTQWLWVHRRFKNAVWPASVLP